MPKKNSHDDNGHTHEGEASEAVDDLSHDDEELHETHDDIAFVLVAYEDAFTLDEHRDAAVAFLKRATEAYAAGRDAQFRLDGAAWDTLNEDFPDIADYLLKTVEKIRENEPDDVEGLPDVEEIFSLGFGFAHPDEVEDALEPVGRFYRIELTATDPPSHEGLPLAFWAQLGAEGAAEVRASALEQRLMDMLEHRQDLIEDALSALIDREMVWELLAAAGDSMMEEALFDFLEEHWPGAAVETSATEQVSTEMVSEFTLEREEGYLYFIDKDGDVSRSKVAKEGEPKSDDEKVVRCGIPRDEDWLYYLGPKGNILRVPMYRAHAQDDD